MPIYASSSGSHDVRQGNVNILQHLQSDRQPGDSTKLFLNLLIHKFSSVNFTQYDIMPYNVEIVS